MIRQTPFHPRTVAADRVGLWSHWAGHLAADRYQLSAKAEYFTIRTGVSAFDTSPLFKYRFGGVDAERFLAGVLARDVRRCRPGRAQYTIWCDGDGYVLEDGVILRIAADEFLLTTVRPNLAYFSGLASGFEVEIADESERLAALAVQGPRSRAVLTSIWPEIGELAPFGVTSVALDGQVLAVSRTGFTGDLGYEIWVEAEAAIELWDAVFAAGRPHGIAPVGQEAVLMARIEAGLLLIDVDFVPARFAWTDRQRSTPFELGLGWMLTDLDGDRPFVGRPALSTHGGSPRWILTGLVLDWEEWDRAHQQAGLIPPKDASPGKGEWMVYSPAGEKVGWSASLMYSPMLQRHIALARVRPELAPPGNRVTVEFTIDHDHHPVAAVTVAPPFYDPPHRRS